MEDIWTSNASLYCAAPPQVSKDFGIFGAWEETPETCSKTFLKHLELPAGRKKRRTERFGAWLKPDSDQFNQNMNNTLIPAILSLLIPIVAIIMGIGIAMLAIYLNYRKRKDMFALYHQERMAAIDKGIELPPLPDAFFTDDGRSYRQQSPRRHLLTGMILLFIGIILFTAFYINEQLYIALLTLTPAGVGLACLIYYFAVGRKEAEALEAAQRAKAAESSQARPS
jgi:hypothetical protein